MLVRGDKGILYGIYDYAKKIAFIIYALVHTFFKVAWEYLTTRWK